MNKTETPSEEQLSALIDDQLGSEERDQIFLALERDSKLNKRVCELRKLKELVQHAYEEVPELPERSQKRRLFSPNTLRAVAASVVLLLGSSAGWFGHLHLGEQPGETFHDLSKMEALQSDPVSHGSKNIILHLDSDTPYKIATALEQTERLLQRYRATATPLKVEIVANGDALSLLRKDVSPFDDWIMELTTRYENLNILACANTLKLLELQGIDTTLIPGVRRSHRSAVEEVVTRLQNGWLYIKV